MSIGRRDFLKFTAAATLAANLLVTPEPVEVRNGIPYRTLGKTGERVSLLGVGGFHIGTGSQQHAVQLIRTAVDEGVNFLDNSWDYNNGRSEEFMGVALKDGYREKVFLMTKFDGRNRKDAQAQLEDSLRRFQVDTIDLWQFHEVIDPKDPERIYAEGAIEFAQEARAQGKIRYIGFTGHKDPAILLDMINRGYDWATVQMPENPFDPHYMSFEKNVLPVALEKNIGVIAMKTLAGGGLLRANVVKPEECLRYTMTLPVSVVVSGMDSLDKIKANIATVKQFKSMEEQEIASLLARTQTLAANGKFEGYKTQQA